MYSIISVWIFEWINSLKKFTYVSQLMLMLLPGLSDFEALTGYGYLVFSKILKVFC